MCANRTLNNPFEGQRWEQDSENIIYLPEIFVEFEKRQDLYLVGSRGTGKTTFLSALNWKTRLENPSIHMQMEKEYLFKEKYIGIYINAMSFSNTIFETNGIDDGSLMPLYSLWAEINVLCRVLESIEGLYDEGYIDITIEDEQLQCNKIYDYLLNLFGSTILSERENADINYNITFLAEVVGALPSTVIDERNNLKWKYEAYSFGDLIKNTLPNLMILCDGKDDGEWCTKICFDQIESAPKFQIIANTLVAKKLSKKIWFIISGLNHRGIDMKKTYVPKHNLTDDDRKYIDLDNEFFSSESAKHRAFYSLAEGICDLRLKHSDNTIDKEEKFKLTTHLGSWDMNQILDIVLTRKKKTSVNDEFKKFMGTVRENHTHNRYLTDYPPYIDTYYYDILKYNKKWRGDLQISREKNSDTGKKYVVIMLALLNEYKFQASTPYVGTRQIMSLCSTTREFLKIMKALFDVRMKKTSHKDLNYFFSYKASFTQNEISMQTKAVLNVANDKYNGIDHDSEKATERMRVFIDTCGTILYHLQAKKELSSLTSNEKGIFTVSFEDKKDMGVPYTFLKIADADTYIQILNDPTENNNTIDFELSKLFAPKYKFSFRKTQNKITIDGKLLNNLCTSKADSFGNASKKLIADVERSYKFNIDNKDQTNVQQTLF